MKKIKFDKVPTRIDSSHSSFADIQVDLKRLTRQAVREALADWLESSEGDNPPGATKCRHCGSDANFISKKPRVLQTQFGSLRYERAYYVCPHCYGSTCPLDERLDPHTSLARLRKRVLEGRHLPVDEIAKSWGLGSINEKSDESFSISLFNARVNQILQCAGN